MSGWARTYAGSAATSVPPPRRNSTGKKAQKNVPKLLYEKPCIQFDFLLRPPELNSQRFIGGPGRPGMPDQDRPLPVPAVRGDGLLRQKKGIE